MTDLTGIGGIIILALALWAIISTINSSASTGRKVIWCLIVFFVPLLGFILWLVFGPRSRR